LSSIAIKYTLILIDIVVFDYIPFPIFTHTTGITHFLGLNLELDVTSKKNKTNAYPRRLYVMNLAS